MYKMAAKGAREPITLECTECKRRTYMTEKNKKNNSQQDQEKQHTEKWFNMIEVIIFGLNEEIILNTNVYWWL